jgi:hypothetical protein
MAPLQLCFLEIFNLVGTFWSYAISKQAERNENWRLAGTRAPERGAVLAAPATCRPPIPPAYGRFGASAVDLHLRGPSAPSVSRAPRPYSRTSRPRPRATRQYTPARVLRMRMATWPRPRPRGVLHSLVSRSLSSAVKGTNRNASPFLLCALPVSPSWPLPRALLWPSSCPLSSSSCPPGAPQHRDVAACPGWPELHREDRQQRRSCRLSAAGARRPHLSPVQAPK